MVLRLVLGTLPLEEKCDTCDVKMLKLEKLALSSGAKELTAKKGELQFKATLEKDRLFICKDDQCLITDGNVEAFNQVKGLFKNLGFRVN